MLEVSELLQRINGRWLRIAALLVSIISAPTALATQFQAIASGNWHNASTWQPSGIPGAGDEAIVASNVSLTVDRNTTIGRQDRLTAITLSDGSRMHVAAGVQLKLNGHLNQNGIRSEVSIGPGAAVRFNPETGETLEWQQRTEEQRIVFQGNRGNRARIGLASGATGFYYIRWFGRHDSLFGGRYGVVEDSFNPRTEFGWRMSMNNTPGQSSVVADHIEFLRCGQIAIRGLVAGEHTVVDLSSITFRDQAKSAADYRLSAFAFDGFGELTYVSPPSTSTRRLVDIVSDTPIDIRFVQGYTFENWVIDGPGFGNARSNNFGGNALTQRNIFQASTSTGGSTNLLANLTENFYFYATGDNPHGLATKILRNDGVLRNYWFEPVATSVTDRGDALLTDGPQFWVADFQTEQRNVTIEHSGVVAQANDTGSLPTFMTFNNSEGVQIRLEHNVAAVNPSQAAIALDENGLTGTGAGVSFKNNILFGTANGIGIGGPRPSSFAVLPNTFTNVDFNLYFGLQNSGNGGRFGAHNAVLAPAADANSVVTDPEFVDSSRNIARWDASLGGPGTAAHAVDEMKKRNDDSGFNPAFSVENLIDYVATGFTATSSVALGDDGLVMGPALYSATQPPGQGPPPTTQEAAIGFVVGTPSALPESDQSVVASLQRLGYDVRLYDDDSPARAITDPNSAILLSSSTVSAKLGGTFSAAQQPVLVWEAEQLPMLGLTGSAVNVNFGSARLNRDIELLPASGFAATGSPSCLFPVNARQNPFLFGTPGGNAEILARIPGEQNQAAIFVYEPGDTLVNGSSASGKRIAWFEQASASATRNPIGQRLFEKVIALLLGETATLLPNPTALDPTGVDTDADGQLDVCDSDDDNDGLSDTYEEQNNLARVNSADALADADSDGFTNLAEFRAGTDPNNDTSSPAILTEPEIVAALLPTSRSARVGQTVTAFATMINSGGDRQDCAFVPEGPITADYGFVTTEASANEVNGVLNVGADLLSGNSQSFVFSFRPTAAFSPIEVSFRFACENSNGAQTIEGVNTLLLSASNEPVADVVALAATQSGDGIVNIPGRLGTGAFSLAAVNLGSSGSLRLAVATDAAGNDVDLPVSILVCQTNPETAACLDAPAQASTVTLEVGENSTSTFSVFVTGEGDVPLDLVNNRIFVLFTDGSGTVRGSTSVGVRTLR